MSNKKKISKKRSELEVRNKKFQIYNAALKFVKFLTAREYKKNKYLSQFPQGGFITEKGSEIVVDSLGKKKIVSIPTPIDVKWRRLSLEDGKDLFYVPLELLNNKHGEV